MLRRIHNEISPTVYSIAQFGLVCVFDLLPSFSFPFLNICFGCLVAEDPSSKNTANGHEDIAQLKTAFALQEEINATRQRDLTNSNKELKARVACLVSDLEVRCRELDE